MTIAHYNPWLLRREWEVFATSRLYVGFERVTTMGFPEPVSNSVAFAEAATKFPRAIGLAVSPALRQWDYEKALLGEDRDAAARQS